MLKSLKNTQKNIKPTHPKLFLYKEMKRASHTCLKITVKRKTEIKFLNDF